MSNNIPEPFVTVKLTYVDRVTGQTFTVRAYHDGYKWRAVLTDAVILDSEVKTWN